MSLNKILSELTHLKLGVHRITSRIHPVSDWAYGSIFTLAIEHPLEFIQKLRIYMTSSKRSRHE